MLTCSIHDHVYIYFVVLFNFSLAARLMSSIDKLLLTDFLTFWG